MPLTQVVAGNRILASDLNQFYNILKGVAASGESVTLIFNAAGSLVFQPSSDPATGTELIQIKNNAGTVQAALSSDGKVYAADGTAPVPGLTWEQDKDTGFYRIQANTIGFATNGTEMLRLDTTGLSTDLGVTHLGPGGLPLERWTWAWQPGMTIESTVVGTASYTTSTSDSSGILATGATSASSLGLRRSLNLVAGAVGGPHGAFDVRYWAFTFLPFQIDANTDCRVFVTDENVTTQPSLTAKHMGIRQTTAQTFLFSTADGTTEQTTAVTAFITLQGEWHIVITFDGSTARCYINGTLRATHTTNVPTTTASTGAIYRAFIVNSAASDKKLYVGPQVMQGVA